MEHGPKSTCGHQVVSSNPGRPWDQYQTVGSFRESPLYSSAWLSAHLELVGFASTTESRRAIYMPSHSDQSPVDSSVRPFLSYDRAVVYVALTRLNISIQGPPGPCSGVWSVPVGRAQPGAMGPGVPGSPISGQGRGALHIGRPPILTHSHAPDYVACLVTKNRLL